MGFWNSEKSQQQENRDIFRISFISGIANRIVNEIFERNKRR